MNVCSIWNTMNRTEFLDAAGSSDNEAFLTLIKQHVSGTFAFVFVLNIYKSRFPRVFCVNREGGGG